MFKIAGILFAAVVLLAGCASHQPNRTAPLNWPPTNAIPKSAVTQPAKPPAPAVSARARAPVPSPSPVTTWESLRVWAAAHHVGAPHRLSSLPVVSYAIGSSNGVMVLDIGSLAATWNEVEIHLGFDPQLIDGEIYLHELDLEKNLEPLLCGPPVTFGTNRVIVIDPGHGGGNSGTHSVLDSRFEKEFTLDWAGRLAPLLETNGWRVLLTRTNDTTVSIADRVAFARAQHAALFLSLHFNSDAPDAREGGIETYCLTPTGMPSTLTRGYPDPWSDVFPGNALDSKNLQLAVRLQGALTRATGLEDRGVRRARFMGVLRGQCCPAALIEAGFLSNPANARLIETPAFREKLAEAVAGALAPRNMNGK